MINEEAKIGHDEKTGCNVKLEVFEGPLPLLIHLIEKNKIDIYDIPIAFIVEEYLNYLESMKQFDIEIASEFLVMASILIQIKSKMLLPITPSDEDGEDFEEDPRQELIDKLTQYKQFKQIAEYLAYLNSEREKCFTRMPQIIAKESSVPQDLTFDELLLAFTKILESEDFQYEFITNDEISVTDKMQDILTLLAENNGTIEFTTVIFNKKNHSEIIATFLALLELIRQSKITVNQENTFAPIYLNFKE